jgi:EmrB/QacA subfamily drug resistance transporter
MRVASLSLLLLVSGLLTMETLDGSMLGTVLPTIARDFGTAPIQTKLALTAYFVATAALIPLSNWLSARFGPRRTFIAAIAMFTVGSFFCAISTTLLALVGARALQGAGAAMMFPIGRMILLGSVSKKDIVRASSYFTMPSALAPVVGPLLAGYVATFSNWRLLFLINVPVGLVGISLALLLVPKVSDTPTAAPFDRVGFMLSSAGLVSLGLGLSSLGGQTIPLVVSVGLSILGALSMYLYVKHTWRTDAPILDLSLFRYRTFKIALTSSFIVRAGVVGALPFLLPLMLQVGFGLSPFESGSITFVGAVATLMTRLIIGPMLRLWGFRRVLAGTALFGALSMLLFAFVTETTPHNVIMTIIFLGSLFRVLQILGLESMIFADVPKPEMGEASCLLSVVKQIAASAGVAYAALILQGIHVFTGGLVESGGDFRTATIFVAIPLALTVFLSFLLSPGDGAEISGHGPATSR